MRIRLLLFVIVFLMAGVCQGQVSAIYGSLRIAVVDATEASVPGASIEVTMPERNWRRIVAGGEPAYLPALLPGE